ncbi:MAG: polysaccharide pyruvyl transferase family protein [Lachnospiraceae bacterium]|jgi:hypothetical protein|nr:polysaccharide pyruvyl transferase family protein [Lachnospiraceae bacterium]
MKIGILTYFASINYGAFLQAYSLQFVLKERYGNNVIVEMINYDSKKSHDFYTHWRNEKDVYKYSKFIECRKKLNLTENALISDDINELSQYIKGQEYDVVIVGSDEVWKTDGMRGFPNAYWLNYDIGRAIRAAYAVSGRSDYSLLSVKQKEFIKESVERFEYIGTRDRITLKELSHISEHEVYSNCDPCFLMADFFRIKDLERIRTKWELSSKKPCVLILCNDYRFTIQFFREYNDDFNILGGFIRNKEFTHKYIYEVNPLELQELIAISDIVITDLFHGTVFSLIQEASFISIENEKCGRGKIENLLLENDLADNLIYKCKDTDAFVKEIYIKIIGKLRTRKPEYDLIIENEKKKADSFFSFLDKVI